MKQWWRLVCNVKAKPDAIYSFERRENNKRNSSNNSRTKQPTKNKIYACVSYNSTENKSCAFKTCLSVR